MSQQSTSKAQSFNDDSSCQEPPQFYVMNQMEEHVNEISDLTATVHNQNQGRGKSKRFSHRSNEEFCSVVIVDGGHLSVNFCKGTQTETVISSDVNSVETLTDSTDVEPGENVPTVMKDEEKNALTDRPNNRTHIRISNFSESMALPDLMKLLKPMGPSKKSLKSATKAIEMLNGQLFNDKMLKVEHSTPTTKQK